VKIRHRPQKATRRAAGAEKTSVTTVSLHSSEARLGHDHLVIKPTYEKKNARLACSPATLSAKTTRVVVRVMRAIAFARPPARRQPAALKMYPVID
jgi:hypothetical protein